MKKAFVFFILLHSILFAQKLEIYGTAHYAFDAIAYSDTFPNRDKLSTVLVSHDSKIGLKHSQNLSSNIVGSINVNRVFSGTQGSFETDDVHYIELYNQKYGAVRAGQMESPASKLLQKIDPFYSRLGEYKSITKGFSELNGKMHDKPYKDTIALLKSFNSHYHFEFSIVTDQDSAVGDGNNTGNTNEPHAIGLVYENGDTILGATMTEVLHNKATRFQQSFRLGAKHKIEDITLAGAYDLSRDELDGTHHAFMLSSQLNYKNMRYLAQINFAKDMRDGNKEGGILQLGADYKYDKDSYVYLQFAGAKIEDMANFEYGQLNYNNDFAFSLGIVYNFSSEIKLAK